MYLYKIEIKSSLVEEAIRIIEEKGGSILFSSEGEKLGEIYAHLPEGILWPETIVPIPAELPAIDWEGQWELHGVEELALGDTLIKLAAGPGFGDFSHPTTQLMIAMMQEHLRAKIVLDVGCGSGILSVAAVALGAELVVGIDIDPQALEHSRENARLNGFEERTEFYLPGEIEVEEPVFILMNMISSEQKVAWESVRGLSSTGMITSGILEEEREEYLRMLESWGWSLVDEKEKSGWLAFYLRR